MVTFGSIICSDILFIKIRMRGKHRYIYMISFKWRYEVKRVNTCSLRAVCTPGCTWASRGWVCDARPRVSYVHGLHECSNACRCCRRWVRATATCSPGSSVFLGRPFAVNAWFPRFEAELQSNKTIFSKFSQLKTL